MSLPYFPLYPADFEADTSHLTLAEDGAYNRLLRLCWMTPTCSLPDDDAWIFRRMRCQNEEDRAVVLSVLGEFFTREKGRVTNARIAKECYKSEASHRKRVDAGSRGGKAKALNNNKKTSSNAKAMLKQPEPEPDITTDNKLSVAADEVLFAEGVMLLRRGGKSEGQARAILGKWRKEHGTAMVIEALGKCQREGAIDPVAFCVGVFRSGKKTAIKPGYVNAGAFGNIPERN